MKNNILLILAVTIISIGIIIATVVISTAGGEGGESGSSQTVSDSGTGSSGTSGSEPEAIPQTDEASSAAETFETLPSIIDVTEEPSSSYDSDAADGIIATAHSLIGVEFVDGGDTPEYGFDNSGFVYYVLRENGYITCPRELSRQSEMGAALTYEELRPGDLAYFYADDMVSVGFGGIYCGDGIMIACLMPGTQVKEINITTPYYTSHFYRGVSLT